MGFGVPDDSTTSLLAIRKSHGNQVSLDGYAFALDWTAPATAVSAGGRSLTNIVIGRIAGSTPSDAGALVGGFEGRGTISRPGQLSVDDVRHRSL